MCCFVENSLNAVLSINGVTSGNCEAIRGYDEMEPAALRNDLRRLKVSDHVAYQRFQLKSFSVTFLKSHPNIKIPTDSLCFQ